MGKEKDRLRNIENQKNRVVLGKKSIPKGYEELCKIFKTLAVNVDGEKYNYIIPILKVAVEQAIQSYYFPYKTYQKKVGSKIYAKREDIKHYLEEIYVPNYKLQGKMSDVAKLYHNSEKKGGLGNCPKGLRLGIDFNTQPKCAVNRCLNHRRCESFYNEMKNRDEDPRSIMSTEEIHTKKRKKRNSMPKKKSKEEVQVRRIVGKAKQGLLPIQYESPRSDEIITLKEQYDFETARAKELAFKISDIYSDGREDENLLELTIYNDELRKRLKAASYLDSQMKRNKVEYGN